MSYVLELIQNAQAHHEGQRTTLLQGTLKMLTDVLNQPETQLNDAEWDALGNLLLVVPEWDAFRAVYRLVSDQAPRYPTYRSALMLWKSPGGLHAGPIGDRLLAFRRSYPGTLDEFRAEVRAL